MLRDEKESQQKIKKRTKALEWSNYNYQYCEFGAYRFFFFVSKYGAQ